MFSKEFKEKYKSAFAIVAFFLLTLVIGLSIRFVTREPDLPSSLSQVLGDYYAVDIEQADITTEVKDQLLREKIDTGEIRSETVKVAELLLSDDKTYAADSLIVFPDELDPRPQLIFIDEVRQRNELNIEPTEEEKNKLELSLIALLEDENIANVQPNYIYTTDWTTGGAVDTPDDFDLTPSASTGNHWYYELSNLREMWQDLGCEAGEPSCGGNPEVTVAVIDTGLAYEGRTSEWGDTFGQMPDMFNTPGINLYTNDGETPNDNIDNDGNGYVDDYNGFDSGDYVYCNSYSCDTAERAEEGHANDDNGHGTYVSNNIVGLVDNTLGSVSPAHNVTLMPIKANFFHANSFGSLELWYAIDYAVDHGADIINMSLAGPSYDPSLDSKLSWAESQGTIVFAASGNDNTSVYYPAAYSSVVAVAAINSDGSRASYSNYGPEIDISAYVGSTGGVGGATYQGSYTCFPCNPFTTNFTSFSNIWAIGTSFASPQAAGMAAMVLSVEPTLTKSEVTTYMYNNAIDVGTAGKDNNSGWGAIDWEATYADVYADNAVPTMTIVEPNGVGDSTSDFFTITWTDDDPDNNALIDIYWDDDNDPDNGKNPIFYCQDLSEDSATDSCEFLTWSVPPGNIYIHGCIKDFAHPEVCATSSGTLTVSAPTTLYDNYYPFYATGGGSQEWILIGNPTVSSAIVNVKVGTQFENNYTISPGTYMSLVPGAFWDGPVEILSDQDVYSSKRTLLNGSFNEFEAISAADLQQKFYYPFYANGSGSGDWILVGNPSDDTSANVNITIGSSVNQNYVIAPGEKITPSWGTWDGPVTVTSDIDVYSTKRTIIGGSFNEHKGIQGDPGANDLAQSFFYPFYATSSAAGSQEWILVGNPDASLTANVNITVGSTVNQNYTIAPGAKITPKWGTIDGPVTVTSDIDVYSTKRTLLNGSFNEHKGIVTADHSTSIHYPFYATSTALKAQDWILVGNPSVDTNANVNIKVGGIIDQNYVLTPGQIITPKWSAVGGPVTITSDIPVYSTKRSLLNGSFNEFKGL